MKKDHTKQINGKTVESGKKDMREFGYKDGQKKLFGGTGKDGEIISPNKPATSKADADTVIENFALKNSSGRYQGISTVGKKKYQKDGMGASAKSQSLIVNGDTIPLK